MARTPMTEEELAIFRAEVPAAGGGHKCIWSRRAGRLLDEIVALRSALSATSKLHQLAVDQLKGEQERRVQFLAALRSVRDALASVGQGTAQLDGEIDRLEALVSPTH